MQDIETANEIAAFIEVLTAEFQQQSTKNGGFSKPFVFPEPTTEAQTEGLRLFMEMLKSETGADIKFVHRIK